MIRGTTPTHTFRLPKYLDLTNFSTIFITYAQDGQVLVEKNYNDITFNTTNNTIKVKLSQAETLRFRADDPDSQVEIQIRADDGTHENAIASEIITVQTKKILKDGEI